MICPRCSFDQPDGTEKCHRCGIIFAKWDSYVQKQGNVRQSIEPLRYEPEKAPSASKKSSGLTLLVLKILCFIGVIYGWYWFLVPTKGLPVPENSYKDKTNAFALVVPPGWEGGKKKNCGGPHGACEVFQITKESVMEGESVINVVVADLSNILTMFSKGTIHFTESNKDEYAKSIVKGIASNFKSFTIESSSIINVDKIPSLRIVGTGFISNYSLKGIFFMTPGSSRVYALSSLSDASSGNQAFDSLVQSFRVTEGRPSIYHLYGGFWGSVKGDAILGLLIGLSIATIRLLAWNRQY
jgi:hypothetical protein